jgi:hypothetical protein
MGDDKNELGPLTPSSAYAAMTPGWAMIETLLGGTAAMRGAGREYLPQYPEETDAAYRCRLQRATLFNMTELTLEGLVGKPFGEPVGAGEDVPEAVQALLEDVDLQGNALEVFARNWFRDGLAKGLSHVLVDFPPAVAEAEGAAGVTLADERAAGRRPYFVHVRPENLVFLSAETVNGREVLTQARIVETVVRSEGWDEVCETRVRVLYPDRWEVWEFVKTSANSDKGEWRKTSEGVNTLGFIPLVTFYSNRTGLGMSKPPLLDLAYLNVSHWQSASDQRNVLTVARFPILAASGALPDGDDGKIVIGPNKWLHMTDPTGRFYYVEHTGAAIAAGRQDLQDLEAQMASYGAEFLRTRPGNPTATARALDSAEAVSPLQAMVSAFKDAAEQALLYMAKWLDPKATTGGTLAISTNFSAAWAGATEEISALVKARSMREISRAAFLSELKRRKILADDYDSEADAAQLSTEAPDAGGMFPAGEATEE